MACRSHQRRHATSGTHLWRAAGRLRTLISFAGELVAAASLGRNRLSFRGAAQLVRIALFSHAPAAAFWAFAQLLRGGLRRYWFPDAYLSLAAGALLPELLVHCELDHHAGSVEYDAVVM